MCPNRSLANKISVMGYSIPVYHEGEKSYVDFYADDPVTGKIRRKKYHLDSIRRKRDRANYAAQLIGQLLLKLSKGWRPWESEKGADRGYTPIEECFEKYLDRIEKTGRKKTQQSYTSRINILKEYISTLENPPKYICQLNREFLIEFLDWCLHERGVGPRTRNNYRNWFRVFADFLIERRYITENPVDGIEKLKEKPKKRKPLTPEMLNELTRYLERHDRYFLLAVMIEYYCFIRPNELSRIRINDISVANQRVFIPGEISKNGRDGSVAINDTVMRLMLDLGVLTEPAGMYLFGPEFRPGEKHQKADAFNKRWAKVRKELGWGDEYQFYSLKDSGIRDLANSAGIVTAKRQARHSDISTTNKYLQGLDAPLPEEAKHFKGGLG